VAHGGRRGAKDVQTWAGVLLLVQHTVVATAYEKKKVVSE